MFPLSFSPFFFSFCRLFGFGSGKEKKKKNSFCSHRILQQQAFTKKPVYTTTGQPSYPNGQNMSICDPYCFELTLDLSKSPELCFTPSGNLSSDCSNKGFSQIPPFTDLTYDTGSGPTSDNSDLPTSSAESSMESTTKEASAESSGWETFQVATIVLGIIVVVLMLALGVTLFFTFKNRKRSGYSRLD
jgi:hypothetical protein